MYMYMGVCMHGVLMLVFQSLHVVHMYIVQYCLPTCLHLFANDLQLAQVHPFLYIVSDE